MQRHINTKEPKVIHRRYSEPKMKIQRKAEEPNAPIRDREPTENISCRIGDNTCAAKHVSVIQKMALFHPMNESKKIQSMMSMQRQYGNRFVQRVIARNAIQTKLKIGQPEDKYEQEADRVAKQVMQMPEPHVQRQIPEEEEPVQTKPIAGQITPLIQRQDVIEEDERDDLLTKSEDIPHVQPQGEEDVAEKDEDLQPKRASGQHGKLTPNVEAQINAIKGSGQPLPASTRAFFEPRFGYDFSRVRVHIDAQAAELARSVNAQALTLKRDIVFGTARYAPETMSGKRLLAHELTHVVQQKSDPLTGVGMLPIPKISADHRNMVACRTSRARTKGGPGRTLIHRRKGNLVFRLYNFDVDRYHVKPQHLSILRKIALYVRRIEKREGKRVVVYVVGHSSRPGTLRYNRQLSRKRAIRVGAYLYNDGVKAIRPKAEGESAALKRGAPEHKESGFDRAVEVILTRIRIARATPRPHPRKRLHTVDWSKLFGRIQKWCIYIVIAGLQQGWSPPNLTSKEVRKQIRNCVIEYAVRNIRRNIWKGVTKGEITRRYNKWPHRIRP